MSLKNQSKSLIEPIDTSLKVPKSIVNHQSSIELIYDIRLRMTLRKTVHAESFLVQSKDTLEISRILRNYQQTLLNFLYAESKTKVIFARGSVAA